MRIFKLSYTVAVIFAFLSVEADACTGCGCRGGPGYRGPDGRCVGWKDLAKKCGQPPTSHCSAEGPNASDSDSSKKKSDQ